MSNTNGITVTAISISTVPATVGVRSRLKRESFAASRYWNSDDATTSVASSPGPPFTSAATHTAMKAPEVPISSTYPAPIRPTRTACRIVLTPLTAAAANTAHVRYESLPPAARTTIAGVSTIPAMARMANWRPSPAASATGGLSLGSNRTRCEPAGPSGGTAYMVAQTAMPYEASKSTAAPDAGS